jgi:hypothetical protein
MSWRSVIALILLAFAGGAAGFAWLASEGSAPWTTNDIDAKATAIPADEPSPDSGFAAPTLIQPSASQAEAQLLVAKARQAIHAGEPLGTMGSRLQITFGQNQPQALATIANGVKQPISNAALLADFDAFSSELSAPVNTAWDRMRYELATLFVLRSPNAKPTVSATRIDRIRKLIIAGDTAEAARLVRTMPGAVAATDWLAKAERAVAVHKALDILDESALATAAPIMAPTSTPVTPSATSAPPSPVLPTDTP